MATLERTRTLLAELAAAMAIPELPQDPGGGIRLTVGGEQEVLLYGGDDATILVVLPICAMPPEPDDATVSWLLHANMFNADTMPFVVAADEAGTLILWGRLRIDEFDGPSLAQAIENLADRVVQMRRALDQVAQRDP